MKKYAIAIIVGVAILTVSGSAIALASTVNRFGFGRIGQGQGIYGGIAGVLGLSPEELNAKLQNTSLPELLDSQGITHQQVYELRQQNRLEHQSEILGISLDELKKELENKTFAQLLDEKGVSFEDLAQLRQEQRLENRTAHLQELVDNGIITPEQMQERLDNFSTRPAKGFGRGQGMHQGSRVFPN